MVEDIHWESNMGMLQMAMSSDNAAITETVCVLHFTLNEKKKIGKKQGQNQFIGCISICG